MSADVALEDKPAVARDHAAEVWDCGRRSPTLDTIAEEVPVALVYNGISHAVMLATPADLEDFGIGFTLSEGIVPRASAIFDIDVNASSLGIEVSMTISAECFTRLKARRRTLAGRTGCGLCGTESLEHVLRPLPQVVAGSAIDTAALHRAFEQLHERQWLHKLTGALHAAAWGRADGSIADLREDVGRHNALDKLIGAMARGRASFDDGFVLLTSRASSEMVQKAATVGVPLIAAISAPTGLAIQLAEQVGITLAGFVRNARHTVYTHPQRLRVSKVDIES